MPTFAAAAQQVDDTGRPAAEGFALQMHEGADESEVRSLVLSKLNSCLPEHSWTIEAMLDGWLLCRPATADPVIPLGKAWEAVRAVKSSPGVREAEPLLLTRLPVTNGSDAQRHFQLWGKVSDARLAAIQAASNEQNMLWSLVQMGVCDESGQGGAWGAWTQKHPGRTPGDGILVAHPDTGYTRHERLMPHLQADGSSPPLFGKNFVERDRPDGLDPMQNRGTLEFPGHGTGTASVIAGDFGPSGKPSGVAPGAKILPLRVSSSVIHLSFQNVCDAFVEAMARGAHVISMSLGGPVGSGLLNSLVRKALDEGIIIVSAAGNDAPTVVFPARIPGIIACAASNALKAPWRFSGLGAEVAITAPGELVWHNGMHINSDGGLLQTQTHDSGTSFATANVAGLAALWLSYHGREALAQRYGKSGIPFAFRLSLQQSSDPDEPFIKGGAGGFGTGIARADALLSHGLPDPNDVKAERDRYLNQAPGAVVNFPFNSWWIILNLPTLTLDGPSVPLPADSGARLERIKEFLMQVAGPECDDSDQAEIGALASTDMGLMSALERVGRGGRSVVSASAVRRYLLRMGGSLSSPLAGKLQRAREAGQADWRAKHPELSVAFQLPTAEDEDQKSAYSIAPPPKRRLRAFAFDPSLATRSDAAAINEIIIPVVFERDLKPGPVGDYIEVVDVDPASDCAYAPADLNHPFLLAQDGLPRSEGNPQFHQQMVYAVAMKTISHFEEALGRPLFWSPLRPWNRESGDAERADQSGRDSDRNSDQFVPRLRLYPHALRDQNAFYSPQKRAILFGYFPAGDSDPGGEYPGGVVFTCLDHGIVSHEMTHAILDGMHVHFIEPTNPDVFAFHEAFADIVALFQRFTYSELLRDQIARARGRLDAGTLMSQLALQFGQATGRHQALRDALGQVVRQTRAQAAGDWLDQREEGQMDGGDRAVTIADTALDFTEENRLLWKRFKADPSLLARIEEPHARGSFLVAAVFDAYLTIYEGRIKDLRRIATGGTGILPDGDLHPDLVNRMADEAAKAAHHVLKMCIRAMDYVPPVDITFGEFLRALITADSDLVPDDTRRYRVAFIEAFRKWGIYPRDVRTLSEETLRWTPPSTEKILLFPSADYNNEEAPSLELRTLRMARRALLGWEPGKSRKDVFKKIKDAQAVLHIYLSKAGVAGKLDPATVEKLRLLMCGIDPALPFQVTNLRPARRIGPNGEFLTEMVFEIIQDRKMTAGVDELSVPPGSILKFRGGVTLIVSMDDFAVRYAIHKRLDSGEREARQRDSLLRASGGSDPDAADYSSEDLPPGWYSDPAVRAKWRDGRNSDREDMRASSCACRRTKMQNAQQNAGAKSLTEPFALLHRI